jgi:hypothetical protein
MNKARKALVAAAVPVMGALISWASTGELNQAEFAVALSGLITAALVWYVPNDRPRANAEAKPEAQEGPHGFKQRIN